ncbi:MAG: hypothetical protein ACKO6N_04600 [Myxococcota bacterium]
MLFTFDENFGNKDFLKSFFTGSPERLGLIQTCLRNLVTGWYEGTLLLVMPPRLREWLCDDTCDMLTRYEKNKLEILCGHHRADLTSLAARLPLTFRITAELDSSKPYVRNDKHEPQTPRVIHKTCDGCPQQLRVPLGYFQVTARTQPTALIAEDETDVRLYRLLGEFFLSSLSSPVESVLRLHCHNIGGGGDTAAGHIKREAPLRPTLIILDSDRKKADGPLGDTAKKAMKELEQLCQAQPPLAELLILSSRMLENILPRELIKEAGLGSASDGASFARACEWKSPPHAYGSEELRFLHGKKGLRRIDLVANPDVEGQYGKEAGIQVTTEEADALHTTFATPEAAPEGGWCTAPTPRCQEKRKECQCIYFLGTPGNTLQRLVENLEKRLPDIRKEQFREKQNSSDDLQTVLFGKKDKRDAMQKERHFLGERVVAWTVTGKPRRQSLL